MDRREAGQAIAGPGAKPERDGIEYPGPVWREGKDSPSGVRSHGGCSGPSMATPELRPERGVIPGSGREALDCKGAKLDKGWD